MSAIAQPKNETRWKATMSGLRDSIQPVRVSLVYRAGLLLVAAMMLLLPIVYIGLIGVVLLGLYWYAVHAVSIFDVLGSRGGARSAAMVLIAYLSPLIAGGILIVFMIKPLFARRTITHFPLTIARRDEPLLYSFVDRLCEVVGAPKPKRIDVDTDVNASASFGEGFWGFVKRDLVLTVGLPLVAGMDLRQLTGVLAHEFGHFTQGGGMRLTYLIRSINGWFARVVYERDTWDEWLAHGDAGSEHWAGTLIVGLARLFVWLTRRVLWLLMIVGHTVSSFMLRQMEFDADRYQARVTGSKSFAPMMEKVELLGLAAQMAMGEVQASWREKRLCDDLPALIRSREPDLPEKLRLAVADHNKKAKTGWFDTHPSHADRIRSVMRQDVEGTFTADLPATALFDHFTDLSRRATVALYHQALGDAVRQEHLVPTESLVVDRGKKKESFAALSRFFQGIVHPICPVFPTGSIERPKDDAAGAEMLLALRCTLTESSADAREALEAFKKGDERLTAVSIVRVLRAAGERVDCKALKFVRADEVELMATLQSAAKARSAAEQKFAGLLRQTMDRLELALAMEQLEQFPDDVLEDRDEYDLVAPPTAGTGDRLIDTLNALRGAMPIAELLRQKFFLLGALMAQLRPDNHGDQLLRAILEKSKMTVEELSRLHAEVRTASYPYEHAEKGISLARFMIPLIPQPRDVGDVHHAAEAALDACFGLYMRLLSDLAHRGERVEESLGLPPLPEPEESK